MNQIKKLIIFIAIVCSIFSINVFAENAKSGDGYVTCNIDGSHNNKGEVFTKVHLDVTNLDTSGNYIYKGVMVGVFKKNTDTQWDLLLDNSILTNSTSIDITDFGDITKYEYQTVYLLAYKIMYEDVDFAGPIITTDWNPLDDSYFKVMTIVLPTLDTIKVTGDRGYGTDVVISGTGTNLARCAYRVFYTKSILVPPVVDADNDGRPDGWLETTPIIRDETLTTSATQYSITVPGEKLKDNSWTYVVFKVGVASSSEIWVAKYSGVYGLSGGSGSGGSGGYLNYIGHNQLVTIGEIEAVLNAPDSLESTYGPYTPSLLDELFGNNRFINNDYLKYRLEFDVVDYDKIKDIKVNFDFNTYNVRNVELIPIYMKLVKRQLDGSFAVLKDLNYTQLGVNKYVVNLGNDNWGNPMIIANQAGRYAIEYRCMLKVGFDREDTLVTIKNDAQVRVCTGFGTYDEAIEPDRPNNKFYIDTKASRLDVKVR